MAEKNHYPLTPLPNIPTSEQTPVVKRLLTLVEQQHALIDELQKRVHVLEAEVARLKKLPKRPNIKPSALDNDRDDDDPPTATTSSSRQRPGSKKRKKRLTIHRIQLIEPEGVSTGSRFLGYQDYYVQDLLIEPLNTRYRLARYRTTAGEYLIGQRPQHLQHTHFGPTLHSYCLHQYHHQRVTQPLLLKQLHEWGVDISKGQLNRILIEHNEPFHHEKDHLLSAGLASATYLHVDDTGARHRGHNGYCTHVGNERFAYFKSTASKSRINFLELLRGAHTDYVINDSALRYMREHKLPHRPRQLLQNGSPHFAHEALWRAHLNALAITEPRHVRIATEAALIGSLIHHHFPAELVILSDDAPQFAILRHALCWIHAERNLQRLLPLNDTHAEALETVRAQLWDLYDELKRYRQAPSHDAKLNIEHRFDALCATQTSFQTLNQALKRLRGNKAELLLVLERPDIPLHNNLSERDIREYVIKRKISGSTRSENGRRCRDTFASLKKTCQKLGISFWDYLLDRTTHNHNIPPLPHLVASAATPIP